MALRKEASDDEFIQFLLSRIPVGFSCGVACWMDWWVCLVIMPIASGGFPHLPVADALSMATPARVIHMFMNNGLALLITHNKAQNRLASKAADLIIDCMFMTGTGPGCISLLIPCTCDACFWCLWLCPKHDPCRCEERVIWVSLTDMSKLTQSDMST